MPLHCSIFSDIKCAYCERELCFLHGEVRFQWGKVPFIYSLGDKIKWVTDSEKKIVPAFKYQQKWFWKYWASEVKPWNCGSPEYKNLWVFDSQIGTWPTEMRECPNCKQKFDNVGVLIKDGSIKLIKAFKFGEIQEKFGEYEAPFDILIINNDGSFSPRSDWYDHPLLEFRGTLRNNPRSTLSLSPPKTPQAQVLFDGYCAFCQQSVRMLRKLDWLGQLTYVDFRDAGQLAQAHIPVAPERLLEEMHLIAPDGRKLYHGFGAVRWIAWRLPVLWLFAPLSYLPGVAETGQNLYLWVARNRFQLVPCHGGVCALPKK